MLKILFFGPYSPPITGQSLAFKTVVDSYRREQYILIDTTRFGWRFFNSIYSIIASFWYLLVKRRRIKVVYFTCTRSVLGAIKDIFMLLIAGSLRKRVVNHLHGADFAKFYTRYEILKPLLKIAYQSVSTTIVLTRSMEKEFNHFPLMKKIVVPNFYPKDFDNKELKKDKRIVVTYFSNLLKSKGIFDFLEAAKLVHQEKPDVQFVVAGKCMGDHLMNGHQMKEGVNDFLMNNQDLSLEYIGEIDPFDRFAFLAQSHIFVLPTYYPTEGFPLSIIEAMRCGNVIITTDHNYLTDVIGSKNGTIVAPRNINVLAQAILYYINDAQLMTEIQNYNREEAQSKYSESTYLQSIKELIGS